MPPTRNQSRSAGQSPPMISSSPSIASEIGCAFNRRVRKLRQEYARINVRRRSPLAVPSCRFLVFVQQERQLALKHLRITTNVEGPTAELAPIVHLGNPSPGRFVLCLVLFRQHAIDFEHYG